MMRTRPLPRKVILLAAATAVLLLALFGGQGIRPVRATPEGSVTYTISQSPALGAVLQVGETVAFTVDVTSAPGAFSGPVVFDLRKPQSTSFAGFGGQAGNIATSCTDNSPASGYVRCVIGAGFPMPAGTLESGTSQELVLNLTVDAAAAGTIYSDGTVQALFSDAAAGFRNAGDAADNVPGGDSLDGSVGGFTVTNILGANPNVSIATTPSVGALFEGSVVTITATFAHGFVLAASPQPIDITVTSADIQASSVACPGGTGTASVVGSTARCSGSTVSNGSTMSVQVRARDTAAGDDIMATVGAPSLGLTAGEAASSADGVARLTVPVTELGLDTVTLPGPGAASPPWVSGSPVTVCTANTGSDVSNDAAAGSAQDGATVFGTSSLAFVSPLASGDFTVSGPSGSVAFSYLGPASCGGSQSGVQFTPVASGTYTVTAAYNGDTTSAGTAAATRGTNALALSLAPANPTPSLSFLTPSSASAGSPGFTLTVNGSNFVSGAVVRWGGSDRATSFISSGQLTASITSSDIASSGTAAVTVFNPAPGGGLSGALSFTINGAPNPAPLISSLTPNSANSGSPGFTLTVNGSSFVAGAIVRWNGADRTTTFLSANQLTANLLTADLATAGSANVSVFNPAPGGGTSPSATFTITAAPNPAPAITSLSPSSGAAGAPAFTLTVNGTGFAPSSVVRWNNADRPTLYVGATQLTATISAGDIVSVGSATVIVYTPAPGGGTSAGVTFTINNPGPMVTTLSPSTASAGGPAFALTVNGSGFVPASVVRWNGADRATVFVGANQLTATIPATDIAATGTASITVFNGSPGGGLSGAATLPIQNPVPAITTLSPDTVGAGSGAFTLTVNGTNFAAGAIIRWNGSDRPTTFVSASQLTAQIPGSDVLATASVTITVFNPAPGGGGSGGQTFSVGTPVLQTTSNIVITPEADEFTARSRLAFRATVTSLTPASVSFIIKRTSDNKYWNGTTRAWQDAVFQNAATKAGDGTWGYVLPGDSRRRFAATDVSVEARAVAAGLPYKAAADATFHIR